MIIFEGLLIPFIGTTLGSACVLFMKKELSVKLQKLLSGFAAGVMIAASVWSLLLPSLQQSDSFIPASVGFCIGMLFLLCIDEITPHMHVDHTIEGKPKKLSKTTMLLLAVTIHNIPEGMAVGILYAGCLSSNLTISGAFALSLGIAIQNFPEGAIISMPLKAEGNSKSKSFIYGMLSGLVEPIAGIITILLSTFIITALPYLLSFAAGAMIYVVIEELVPEMANGEHYNMATIAFMLGFVLMMILDVALG